MKNSETDYYKQMKAFCSIFISHELNYEKIGFVYLSSNYKNKNCYFVFKCY